MHNLKKNNYFIRIHRRLLFRNALYYYQHNIIHTEIYTEAPPNVKVTTAMVSFASYRFRNRKVRWWLNVITWQRRMCLEVSLSQSSLLLFAIVPSLTASDWNEKCSESWDKCKDLLGRISFKLHKINPDYFYQFEIFHHLITLLLTTVWLLIILNKHTSYFECGSQP